MYIFVFVPAGVYIMKILNIIFPICFLDSRLGFMLMRHFGKNYSD